ncbi:MAG TPA: hypothetical protein VN922_21730 [Bacteroidia bacterium]|nr:hypothetical protein [Bacteroidia bacterium]
MGNKYLEKIANIKSLGQAFAKTTPLERVGLGMSGTGLAMSAANLKLGLKRDSKDVEKMNIEEKSLDTLKDIHKTLAKSV